jgi:hypothetical protein
VVREGVGAGGEMNQALYAHMNNKRKMKKKITRAKGNRSWLRCRAILSSIPVSPKSKNKRYLLVLVQR